MMRGREEGEQAEGREKIKKKREKVQKREENRRWAKLCDRSTENID